MTGRDRELSRGLLGSASRDLNSLYRHGRNEKDADDADSGRSATRIFTAQGTTVAKSRVG